MSETHQVSDQVHPCPSNQSRHLVIPGMHILCTPGGFVEDAPGAPGKISGLQS